MNGERILIIEDDHDIRTCLREALEMAGCVVFSAANGKAGLEMLLQMVPPDLIVLDQNMPLLSGPEFLRIKNATPQISPIPVIVVSASTDQCRSLGAVEFHKKPVDLERLLAAMKRHCPAVKLTDR